MPCCMQSNLLAGQSVWNLPSSSAVILDIWSVCFVEIPRKADDRQQDSIGKGKPNRANGASPAAAPAMTAKEKAQAIIAASFKEVKQDLARKANAGQHHYWIAWGWVGGGGGNFSFSAGLVTYVLPLCPSEWVLCQLVVHRSFWWGLNPYGYSFCQRGNVCNKQKCNLCCLSRGCGSMIFSCFFFHCLGTIFWLQLRAVEGRCKRWPSCLNSGFVGFILGSCVVFAG